MSLRVLVMGLFARYQRALGTAVFVFVIGWAFVYALSYLRIVNSDHPYESASRWIYAHIPAGSTILNVHWDDALPASVSGKNPAEYRYKMGGGGLRSRGVRAGYQREAREDG